MLLFRSVSDVHGILIEFYGTWAFICLFVYLFIEKPNTIKEKCSYSVNLRRQKYRHVILMFCAPWIFVIRFLQSPANELYLFI
jgi:hypothetical protein